MSPGGGGRGGLFGRFFLLDIGNGDVEELVELFRESKGG